MIGLRVLQPVVDPQGGGLGPEAGEGRALLAAQGLQRQCIGIGFVLEHMAALATQAPHEVLPAGGIALGHRVVWGLVLAAFAHQVLHHGVGFLIRSRLDVAIVGLVEEGRHPRVCPETFGVIQPVIGPRRGHLALNVLQRGAHRRPRFVFLDLVAAIATRAFDQGQPQVQVLSAGRLGGAGVAFKTTRLREAGRMHGRIPVVKFLPSVCFFPLGRLFG